MEQTTTTKVTIRNNKRVVSERVFEGYTPAPAYEPEHIGRISRQEVEALYIRSSKYQQYMASEERKEAIWQQILQNRAQLKDIVLFSRYNKDEPYEVAITHVQRSNFTERKECINQLNIVNRLINGLFNYSKNALTLIPRFQQPQIAIV